MNDDIFKKIKNLMSGSLQVNEQNSNLEEEKFLDEDKVNNFMNQILDAAWLEEDMKAMCAPSYHLSKKEKSYWLMNTTLKSLFNIKSGIEIIPIESGEKYTLCMIGHSSYSIPNDLIVCSGWN